MNRRITTSASLRTRLHVLTDSIVQTTRPRIVALSLAVASTCGVLAGSPVNAQVQQLDKIAVIVGKSVVTQSTLDRRLSEIKQRALAGGMALPPEETLKKQVLDHVVLEELQLQLSERIGLRVNDSEVNAAIKRMQAQNKMDEATFIKAVEQDGTTIAQLQQRIHKEITIQQTQRALVTQRIQISALEIDNFLKSGHAQFWISPEYHIGHILVGLPQAANNDDVATAEKKAQELYTRLQSGAVFADVAIAQSDGALALKGGDIGWRRSSDLPSLFADIVPTLEKGGLSKPARSGAGFHILKLYDKRGEQSQVVKQSKVRHILIKPSEILTNEEAKAKLNDIRQEIIDGKDFAKLAKKHSEDTGSMLAGGDLGWSNPGQFVPAFEKAIANAKGDDISQPFRSRFGWHILQVTDRRDEDMTEQLLRNKAHNVLLGRRFEDELQVWLRELRDEAFIEFKS